MVRFSYFTKVEKSWNKAAFSYYVYNERRFGDIITTWYQVLPWLTYPSPSFQSASKHGSSACLLSRRPCELCFFGTCHKWSQRFLNVHSHPFKKIIIERFWTLETALTLLFPGLFSLIMAVLSACHAGVARKGWVSCYDIPMKSNETKKNESSYSHHGAWQCCHAGKHALTVFGFLWRSDKSDSVWDGSKNICDD